MYKDSYRHRKKYYVTLFVSLYVIIFTICALVVAANWKYVKMLFEARKKEVDTELVLYNDVFAKVQRLEELSKAYHEKASDGLSYQLRTVVYIRSAYYPDEEWGHLLDYCDSGFINFVKQNQGDEKVSDLRGYGKDFYFTNPNKKQKVDFDRLFLNLNAIMKGSQAYMDYVGWGGYVCQQANAVKDFSSLSQTDLEVKIKLNMQMDNSEYGAYARYTDYDAAGIYNVFQTADYTFDSIYLSCVKYYASFNERDQIKNFITYMDFEEDMNLRDTLYERLKYNSYLQVLCDNFPTGEFDYPDNTTEDGSNNAKIFRASINAYIELLGM